MTTRFLVRSMGNAYTMHSVRLLSHIRKGECPAQVCVCVCVCASNCEIRNVIIRLAL